MTAAHRPEPALDFGSRVTDGEAAGVVLAVDHIPGSIGKPRREDVYVLWLPNLPEEV